MRPSHPGARSENEKDSTEEKGHGPNPLWSSTPSSSKAPQTVPWTEPRAAGHNEGYRSYRNMLTTVKTNLLIAKFVEGPG